MESPRMRGQIPEWGPGGLRVPRRGNARRADPGPGSVPADRVRLALAGLVRVGRDRQLRRQITRDVRSEPYVARRALHDELDEVVRPAAAQLAPVEVVLVDELRAPERARRGARLVLGFVRRELEPVTLIADDFPRVRDEHEEVLHRGGIAARE